MKKERHPEATKASPLEASKNRRAILKALPSKSAPAKTWAEREAEKTQDGLAKKLAEQYGEDFKYCPGLGWQTWTGTHWKPDKDNLFVNGVASSVARSLLAEAADLQLEAGQLMAAATLEGGKDSKEAEAKNREAKELKSLAKKTLTAQGQQGVVTMARVYLPGDAADFDQDIWLLNCANGTLNLKTGECYKHARADLITRLIDVPYDPDAGCPLWDKFMLEFMQGDTDLIAYLQRLAGYCLTGSTREHGIFVFQGVAGSGKSTFMTTLEKLMGKGYADQIPTELLLRRPPSNPHGATHELAKLAGKRLVTVNEIDKGAKFSEASINQMTGGDPIAARRMYAKDDTKFIPQFKLLVRANNRPIVDAKDTGFWRRAKVISCEAKPQKIDMNLPDRLKEEYAGILAWAVRGFHECERMGGLREPEKVKRATQQYRNENNSLMEFLTSGEMSDIDPEKGMRLSGIHLEYQKWAELNAAQRLTSKEISAELKELGWVDKRRKLGMYFFPPVNPATPNANPSESGYSRDLEANNLDLEV